MRAEAGGRGTLFLAFLFPYLPRAPSPFAVSLFSSCTGTGQSLSCSPESAPPLGLSHWHALDQDGHVELARYMIKDLLAIRADRDR